MRKEFYFLPSIPRQKDILVDFEPFALFISYISVKTIWNIEKKGKCKNILREFDYDLNV